MSTNDSCLLVFSGEQRRCFTSSSIIIPDNYMYNTFQIVLWLSTHKFAKQILQNKTVRRVEGLTPIRPPSTPRSHFLIPCTATKQLSLTS